jgi:AcrR family transcriptional regulator
MTSGGRLGMTSGGRLGMSRDVGEVQALDGRALGVRGARTRRRLLDATVVLLEQRGARDLRVVEIAREVGTSAGAFYQYFRDLDDALLVVAREAGDALAPLAVLVDGLSVDRSAGLERARRFVDRFVDGWDEHRAVLRFRNLQAQEGDQRFRRLRKQANAPFMERFAAEIGSGRVAGRVPGDVSPVAGAAALMALLERMATFHEDLEELGVGRTDLVDTTARILHQTVAGV